MDTIIWLALMITFMVVEASTVAMVSLWFAAGSLIAMIASMLNAPIWLQVALFVVASALLLVCFGDLVRKRLTPKLTKTNVDAIVDSKGYVTADIDNISATGSVKLGAMEWTARSTDGRVIPKGTLVKVDRIEGVKAFVTPAEAEVTV